MCIVCILISPAGYTQDTACTHCGALVVYTRLKCCVYSPYCVYTTGLLCIRSVVGWCPYGVVAEYTLRIYCVYTALICAAECVQPPSFYTFQRICAFLYTSVQKCTQPSKNVHSQNRFSEKVHSQNAMYTWRWMCISTRVFI